jgi:hypothetical protein
LQQTHSKLLLIAILALFSLAQRAVAQNPSAALASLPEADALIYISPQRILNEAAPRVMSPAEVTKMRAAFGDIKTAAGIDPATIEYIVIAVRFNKPASNLSFNAPDMIVVAGGDFSSESLLTLSQVYLQDKVRTEKHGSKTMSVMKIDPLVAEAEKNPLLKPFVEVGAVALSANSIAIGTLPYLRSAIDAADGNGRISSTTLESLFRDPNVLIAASGAPLASFARSFGLLGLENTSREARCDTRFGNFYAAVTMTGASFVLRGAMNADNPDTAKIINNLLSGLMKQGLDALPDKNAQAILQGLKMSARDNEVVWEADIPEKVVADYLKPAAKDAAATSAPAATKPKRPVRKKRTKH